MRPLLPALIIFLIAGCASTPVIRKATALKERTSPSSLRAEGTVELKKTFTLKGRASVTVKSPDLFRIEVTGPFNQPMALLLSDGRRFRFTGPDGKGGVFSPEGLLNPGGASANSGDELFSFGGAPSDSADPGPDVAGPGTMKPDGVEGINSGAGTIPEGSILDIPADERGSDRTAEPPYPLRPEQIVSLLLGANVSGNGTLWEGYESSHDEGTGGAVRFVRLEDGVAVFKVEISDFRAVGGAEVPFNISIDDGRQKLSIRYSSVEINPEIDSDFFTIEPAGP